MVLTANQMVYKKTFWFWKKNAREIILLFHSSAFDYPYYL